MFLRIQSLQPSDFKRILLIFLLFRVQISSKRSSKITSATVIPSWPSSDSLKYYIKFYSFPRLKRNRIFIFLSAQKKVEFFVFRIHCEDVYRQSLNLFFYFLVFLKLYLASRHRQNEKEINFKGFDRPKVFPK